jgi:hypothetical protein
MDEPSQKCPSRQDYRLGRNPSPIQKPHACDLTGLEDQVIHLALNHRKPLGLPDRCLHCSGIELSIRLGSWTSNRRPFSSIENPELNSTSIRHPTHQAVKRVDLADEVTLPEPADGGIARHCPDGLEAMGHKGHVSPHASGPSCSLAAGVPAPHHNDIESHAHAIVSSSTIEWGQKDARQAFQVFHVKRRGDAPPVRFT